MDVKTTWFYIVLLGLASVQLGGAWVELDQCSDAVAVHNGLCYLLNGRQLNHTEARDWCTSQGGELAVLDSQDVNYLVSELIRLREKQLVVTVTMPRAYHYFFVIDAGIDIRGKNNVTFKVQSCRDVHIGLAARYNDTDHDFYEIVLGGWANSMSVIRRQKQGSHVVEAHHHPDDCNHLRPFWISWIGGRIAVGTGSRMGYGEFMNYTDPHPYDISYLAVSPWPDSAAKYEFHAGVQWAPGEFWVQTLHHEPPKDSNSPSTIGGTGTGSHEWVPSSASSGSPEVCVALDRTAYGDFQWLHDDCGVKKNAICQVTANSASVAGSAIG